MIEMYKSMADPNYFPIEVETEEKGNLVAMGLGDKSTTLAEPAWSIYSWR